MAVPVGKVRDHAVVALAVVALLYFGRPVIVPLLYGLLLALVLYPMVARLEARGVSRAISIGIVLLVVTALFTALILALIWQMNAFIRELPRLSEVTGDGVRQLQDWLRDTMGMSIGSQERWRDRLVNGLTIELDTVLIGSLQAVFQLLLIPIITALLLFNREGSVHALIALMPADMRHELPGLIRRGIEAFAAFIVGMVQVYAVVGVLNSAGLLALGVPNAFLFGFLTAVMTIVPYFGIIVSALLPIAVAWITTGSIWHPLGVIGVFALVQYLEAALIFPRVVGRRLRINTLAALLIILSGGVLWGVSGMILLLPFMAVVIMAGENIPFLRPWVLLLGPVKDRRR